MFKDISSHIHTIYNKVKIPESLVKLIPTNEPKVSGYLPPVVYNLPQSVYAKISAFKEKRVLESVEMAVAVILEEYFGLTQTSMDSGADTTTSRLETLEAKCSSLGATVAELQAAIATIQASSSQPVDYQRTPLHQHSPLPLEDKGAATESINSPSVDQCKSLEPAAVNYSQMTKSESQQLPTLKTLSNRQAANNLSVEDTEVLELAGAMPAADTRNALIASTSGLTDIELELVPGVQGQQNFEQQGGETFNTPMTQVDLAKRLGVATSTVSRTQSKLNFPEWSKHRDPEGIAWVKSADTKLFYPQNHKQV